MRGFRASSPMTRDRVNTFLFGTAAYSSPAISGSARGLALDKVARPCEGTGRVGPGSPIASTVSRKCRPMPGQAQASADHPTAGPGGRQGLEDEPYDCKTSCGG